MLRPVFAVVIVMFLAGCAGMRFSVDFVRPEKGLSETVVLGEKRAMWTVAMIDVSGMITSARPRGLLSTGESPVSLFTEALRKAERDDEVKAIVVHIDSRGGTVTASDLMYAELLHFKETSGKPVVVLMGDYCASGGYYLACAGDELIAGPTTVTGSIGVILQTFEMSGMLTKIGVTTDAITSGPNKAVGSPLKPMSADHRALLQGIVSEFYGRFRDIVTTSRPALDAGELDRVTDGRVVTGAQALEAGLIDSVGGVRDAFDAAQRRAGIESAKLVRYHQPGERVGSVHAEAPEVYVNVDLPFDDEIGFYYLWDPRVW